LEQVCNSLRNYFLRTKVEPEKNFGFKLNILVQLFYSDVSGTTTCVDIIFGGFLPKHPLLITMAHRQKLIKSQSKFF
jgi:hypothetical protein